MTSQLDRVPLEEHHPETQDELVDFVASTQEKGLALYPAGGKSAWDYGHPIQQPGVELHLRKLNRVIDFPARDMTVTVEAGMTFAELQFLLRSEQQQLPIDVSNPDQATLGGIVACNQSGSRRFGFGTLRDYVIGITAVDAHGRPYHAGGRVVKNVAGYDLCKLLTGSLGTLGVITQLTFKLKPQYPSCYWVQFAFEEISDVDLALEMLITSETRPVAQDVVSPLAVSALSPSHALQFPDNCWLLCVAYEGVVEETNWQRDKLREELGPLAPSDMTVWEQDRADVFLQMLTAFPVSAPHPVAFRATMLPAATPDFLEHCHRSAIPALAHAANGIVVGSCSPERLPALVELRTWAREHSGNLIFTTIPDELRGGVSLWGEEDPSWKMMRQIKAKLDPQNRWNPGRFLV